MILARVALCGAVGLACAGATGAIDLISVQDTRIKAQAPDSNAGSSSGMNVGYYGGDSTEERSLIQFDLSALSAGTPSATLTLCIKNDYNAGSDLEAEIHRVTAPWVEMEATWNSSATSTPWANPGGDFDAAVIDVIDVGSTIGSCHDFDVTALVNDWIDGTHPNHGLLVKSTGYLSSNWTQFGSRETVGMEPVLTIVEDVPLFADGFESGDTSQWSSAVGSR